MWCRLTSRVSSEHIDALLRRANAMVSSSDHKDSLHWIGKDFFVGKSPEDDNFDLLGLFHLELWPEIANTVALDVPVIDHASLLIKGAGAAGPAGGFPISIPDRTAARMAESMVFVRMAKGEAIAFDSFEPHMSGPNTTPTPRPAMKIAYAEGKDKTQYLTRTDTLECSSLGT